MSVIRRLGEPLRSLVWPALGLLVLAFGSGCLGINPYALLLALALAMVMRQAAGSYVARSAYHGGWYVERDGRRCALLTNPRCEDMFWVSYTFEPLTDVPAERGADHVRPFVVV